MDLRVNSIGGLSRAPAASILSELLSQTTKRALILCSDEAEADRWFADMQFFFRFHERKWENTELMRLTGWEHSPYRSLQPGHSSRLERLETLEKITSANNLKGWIVISSLPAFLQSTPEIDFLKEALSLRVKTNINPETLSAKLNRLGYQKAESVEDRGTFAVRGGLIDIFTPTMENPIRLEFFDDYIESIRVFNPESQRSIRQLSESDSVNIVPAREFPCDATSLLLGRERIKDWCDQVDIPRSSRERISSLLSQGIAPPEMDYLISFFQNQKSNITNLMEKNSVTLFIAEPESIKSHHESWLSNEQKLFQSSKERMQPIPPPTEIYVDLFSQIRDGCWDKIFELRQLALNGQSPKFSKPILEKRNNKSEIDQIHQIAREAWDSGKKVIITANSQSQVDRISFLLAQKKIQSIEIKSEHLIPENSELIFITQGVITESFQHLDKKIIFISEDDLFGEKKHSSIKSKKNINTQPVAMDDLTTGDLVVHLEHGIGKYLGLTKMTALGSEGDFASLEYSDGDKLYVPIYRLESINRYVGTSDSENASLDKLGSGSFTKTKDRVKSAVKEIAQDLLKIHAERAMREGYAFSRPDDQFRAFEAEFPYDETADQDKAIEDSIEDMCQPRPMDRLICGDVGFGKTEVAIRAAFKAAQDGKQVAVLVPTTILAEQHYITFSQRMKNLPVKIASISRFRSKKEQEEIVKNLGEGKTDIVIGTHRLLSSDVQFKDLGLLIIDEEQRFGVEHKEKLKKIRANTDILTLTATPIPRTLQMSLMGLKDVSIIRTPPGDRMSIKTYLSIFDENVIKDAIENEMGRGGQIFFIHNRVQDIEHVAELIRNLVPQSKVVVAHGQMPEGQLEKAMIGFYKRNYDVLVATAIIENGLDVPNANTLIVNRADTFGLSQLYQIRGRVGRSQTRAYCYLLLPESGLVSQESKERLSVLQRFTELGSGYSIATHDLEIRGGGDVLGQAQSGHIASVGYDMYLELLQDEIQRLKGGAPSKKLDDIEINIPYPALLPHDFVPDMKSRMALYRRLSFIETEEQAEDAKNELADRYGPPPKEALELLGIVRLKILMRRMGLKSLTLGPKGISISPGKNPILEPGTILMLVQSRPKQYAILPEGKFVIHGSFGSVENIHAVLRQLLQNAMQ